MVNESMTFESNIYKKTLYLAVPMIIQNGITNAVGLVDNIMVGSLGTESITAVSIVIQLVFVYSLAIFGGISGPTIFSAQFYGKGDIEGVRKIFRLKIWICAACMLLASFILIVFGNRLISLFLLGEAGTIDASATLNIAIDYLKIMLIGLIPFSISQVYASTLRETGDSVKPMIAGACSVVVDVVFNYLLIFGALGFPELGVRGAAIATVLSRLIELIVLVVWSHNKKDVHTFLIGIYDTIFVPKDICLKVIKKGFPVFINELAWAGGLATLTQCLSMRGLTVVAGLNISNALCNLLNVVFVTLGSATGIIIGQMLGAKEFELAKSSSLKLARFSTYITLVITVILIALAFVFPSFYNTTAEVRQLAKHFIIITALFFPIQSLLNCYYFIIRSGGRTVITFLSDSVFSWAITIPIAYALCLLTNLPVLLIYTILQSLDVIKTIIGYILIKKGIWITNLVSD